MWGFDSIKDLIQVIFMPSVIFALGVWLPRRIEAIKSAQRKKEFEELIRREMHEMEPHEPEKRKGQVDWTDYLRKRFIHEDIFLKPSENRDFIISLNPDLAYHEAQLWNNFHNAVRTRTENDNKKTLIAGKDERMAEYGARWCVHLMNILVHLEPKPGELRRRLYEEWETLILKKHPDTASIINSAKEALAKLKGSN